MTEKLTIEKAIYRIGIGKFHIFLILILGIITSCEAMEILILSFLNSILVCVWKITSTEISILNSVVFLGIIIGGLFLGKFSDNYGRKITLILSNIGVLYFGLLSAATPTFYWMIIIRFIIGIFIGGISASVYSLLAELTPINYRGITLVILPVFWSIGAYFITLLSFLVTEKFGWQIFLLFTAIPIFLILFVIFWISESPRFLLFKNQERKSLEILNRIAKWNNAEPIVGLCIEPVSESSFKDLFHSNYFLTTIFTSYLWFTAGLSYYSIILIVFIINGIQHRCLQNLSSFSKISVISNQTIDNSCCLEMNWSNYRNMFVSITGEIFFLPLTIIFVNVIGRKKLISCYLLINSIGYFCLNFCLNVIQLNILLFILRGSLQSYFNVNFLYTTEVFPTSIRSFGLGFGLCFAEIGNILAAFVVNVLIVKYSFIGGIMMLACLNVVALCVSFFLPYETQNRILYQTADHHEICSQKSDVIEQKNNYKTITK